jgi:hypothetical protein
LKAFIQTAAMNETLCFYNIHGDFQIVSVENLYTTWEGKECEIVVYRRAVDKKILVNHPGDNDDEASSTWEGSKPDDSYRLEQSGDGTVKFDGKNGRLYDTDGDEIKCFCKSDEPPRKKSFKC